MTRQIGLAPLSVLGTEPHRIVEAAADAGFDFVGLRVRPVTDSETFHDVSPGSAQARRVHRALRASGIGVRDIEFILLDGVFGRQQWLPMLEAGAELGASSLTVAIADTDSRRVADTLAQLVADAGEVGIVPTIEPIAYQAVRQVSAAAELARQVGCRVLIDALHMNRAHVPLVDIAQASAEGLAPMLQLNDGPVQAPTDRQGLLHESRADRALPGRGEWDLAGLIQAVGPDTPISLEVPNPLSAELGVEAYARELRRSVEEIL